MNTDHFSQKAKSYDQDKSKRDNVSQIASAICDAVKLDRNMHLADFGSGTGLLLADIAPYVGEITAIDVSASMNAQLQAKLNQLACPVELLQIDLETTALDRKFDGIISSMTLHHIKDVPVLFTKLYAMLKDKGFIALADLDKEDGHFHSENEGVYHTGFDRNSVVNTAIKAGFKDVAISTASTINKAGKDYPVFLLVGYR